MTLRPAAARWFELLTDRVPAGVDDAAKVKAEFLAKVAKGEEACALVSRAKATELLGTTTIGPHVATRNRISGQCWIYGMTQIGLDPTDPHRGGRRPGMEAGDAREVRRHPVGRCIAGGTPAPLKY